MRTRTATSQIARWAALGGLLGLLAVPAACIYDKNDACSPGEVKDPTTDACVCPPNSIPVKRPITVLGAQPTDQPLISMCQVCTEHSSVVNGACVCDSGFVMGTSGCVESNLGATCASDNDCLNGDSHHCQIATGATSGYCTTTGCTSNAECKTAAHYACVTNADTSFCRRPPMPLNEGNACTMQGLDPTCGAEAPVCLIGKCVAIGCTDDTGCSPTRKCCDLSALSPQSAGVHACLETCL